MELGNLAPGGRVAALIAMAPPLPSFLIHRDYCRPDAIAPWTGQACGLGVEHSILKCPNKCFLRGEGVVWGGGRVRFVLWL